MKNIKLALASDHAGFDLKNEIKAELELEQFHINDFGCFSNESVDYPDFAFLAAKSVSEGITDNGILICGSGTGMSIVANKVPKVRAANCHNVEIARLAVAHNNINVLCLGSRFMNKKLAIEIIRTFLTTDFEGGRHINRINKIHILTDL